MIKVNTLDTEISVQKPLLSHPPHCVVGRFLRRHKRFSVAIELQGTETWIHSNNSGSMLGLVRKFMPVLLSPANNPARKLPYTQEAVWMPRHWHHDGQSAQPCAPSSTKPEEYTEGFWVGVNTSVPNKLLEAAFHAGKLPFAQGYTHFKREAKRGTSRLDACISAENKPTLWVECKNVTMVEDDEALFPDAATERGQKHLMELMDIVRSGERAVMFYLVQRPDGCCFGPADSIDPTYAKLFWQAVTAGVEIYPMRATVSATGIDLGEVLPLTQVR